MSDFLIEDAEAEFYHSGKGRRRDVPLEHRRIIAWDGEGMMLSGNRAPQHYVVFGCSADTENPLIGEDLSTVQLLDYIVEIGARFPGAVHIGYGFRYDSNMIIKGLSVNRLMELKANNETYFNVGAYRYRVAWLPGKRLTVTRSWGKGKRDKTTVQIDDIASFFAAPFISAIESVLSDELTDEDRDVIAHGKAERGQTQWEDLPEVLRYWRAEIRLMERLGEKFRAVMYEAGFMLNNWYGPGALSSYIIRTKKLRDHLVNGPNDGLPHGAHIASKHAYAGGRFELFRFGRFEGPVYGLDINSAYPYAIANAPSLGREHGEWQWLDGEDVKRIAYFGCYRIRFRGVNTRPLERRAMPLFHRDEKGSISYPTMTEGWYWSPEAAAVFGHPGVEVIEAWVWMNDGSRPFAFLADMYQERKRIGKKNVLSMPYKLGPNSLYGKLAQRVGHRNGLPPRSHCLPLAGWVTSYTRASLFRVMRNIPASRLIAVETDGIYTTADPNSLSLDIGDELGQWDLSQYDEMLYVQNGLYHRRNGKEWHAPKARGLDVTAVDLPTVTDYLRRCQPGEFPTLSVTTRPRFVGLTAAMASNAPLKVRHCRWEKGERELSPGGKGKRAHVPAACPACVRGDSAYDAPHSLIIRTRSTGGMSKPHHLPWEDSKELEDTEKARELDAIAEDYVYA